MAKKSTKIETQRRVQEILDLYLRGYTYTKIIRYGQDKWGVCTSSVEGYIVKANALMERNNADKIKDTCNRILSCQWDLYEKCLLTRNPGVARLVLVDIGKTTGAVTSTPANKPVESDPEIEALSDDELEAKIKQAR